MWIQRRSLSLSEAVAPFGSDFGYLGLSICLDRGEKVFSYQVKDDFTALSTCYFLYLEGYQNVVYLWLLLCAIYSGGRPVPPQARPHVLPRLRRLSYGTRVVLPRTSGLELGF